ncbi:hypothetical protein BU15DRAFT_38468 [Melanogaster broomeanus]|nr:hypothetical protein BU15DRAFT_38468 [Melanogaster broomeanus]
MLPTLSKTSRYASLAATARRSASSKAKSQSHLDTKMQALVSLYHQSDRFITPENLSAAIDETFTTITPTSIGQDKIGHTAAELDKIRQSLQRSPTFFLGKDPNHSTINDSEALGPGWTDSRTKRTDRVYQALMGTFRDGKPSWLAVKEKAERVKMGTDREGWPRK